MGAFDVSKDERVIFVFTHPDDELAVSAFIGRLQSAGVPLLACWIHSTPIRERESRAALREIGADEGSLKFLSAKDGEVMRSISQLRGQVTGIIDDFGPTRVVTHAFEQGHLDHDATNLLVNMCFDGPVYEAPYYHTYLDRWPTLCRFSSTDGEETIDLSPQERRLKKRLVGMYPSQTIRRNVLTYQFLHLATLRPPPLFQKERLRPQTHKDFFKPNHPPELARRIEASEPWRKWVNEASSLL